ncbi:MAG: DNA cytosine methyltransferase, partial [Cyanobacteria bacterium J06633_8]
LPEKDINTGWFETIKDLIPHMEDDKLLTAQQEALEQYRAEVDLSKSNIPIYIQRIGRGANRPIAGWNTIPTITRSIFTDQNDANRNKFANIVTGSPSYPVVKNVSIRAMARLQGFPDWYQFDENTSVAGSSIGYSVPPIPFSKILTDLLPVASRQVERHEFDFYQSPVWYAIELLKHQHIEGTVLEPCVGDGAIADILDLSPLIRDIFTNDIDSKRCTNSHLDATDPLNWVNMPVTDWVITNPPYSDSAAPIIQNAFNHARIGVAVFVRLSFLEPCSDRADFLKKHPPTKILYLPRFCFRKDKNRKWSTDSATIVCLIWDKTAQCSENIIIPESNIDLFYKNPDQQPSAKEITQVFENKIYRRLTTYKPCDNINIKVAAYQATDSNQSTENNRGNTEMTTTLFAEQISVLQQQINAMQEQLSAMQQFDDKSKDLKNLLTDCMETAKELGVESQLQEEMTKIVWGDDFANKIAYVDAVSSDPSVLETATQPENTSKQTEIPDGLSVREFGAVKKQVKEKLNLSKKARNNALKDAILEKIANTSYDNEALLSELQSINVDNDKIWILAKTILKDMEQPPTTPTKPTETAPEPKPIAKEIPEVIAEAEPQTVTNTAIVNENKISDNNKYDVQDAKIIEGYTPKISEYGQKLVKEAEQKVAAEKAPQEVENINSEPQQQEVETVATQAPEPKQEPVKNVGFGKVEVQQTETVNAKQKQLEELQSLVQTFA